MICSTTIVRVAIAALSMFIASNAVAGTAQECECGEAAPEARAQQTTSQAPERQTSPPRTLTPPAQRESNQREAREREAAGRPVNLMIEVTITDQAESEPAQKKTVTMIVADRTQGRVRAAGIAQAPNTPGPMSVRLNVDAYPEIQANDSVRLRLTLEYEPLPPAATDAPRRPSTLNEMLTVIMQPGKPLTVSRAVDPFTNRRTSVDVTVTIQK